jgi:single-strand selective monofunctional uracil DNA glycosylase
MELIAIAEELCDALRSLRFSSPVVCVYNPLEYARATYAEYIHRYGRKPREILFLGMNPGPWGMVQTGVPFGTVGRVRDWLKITGNVARPPHEHPARPVLGFDCRREEISGQRLWGWAEERFETPQRFFAKFFVANYCPLAFLEASGRNLTPDRLPAAQRGPLLAACDRALRRTVEYFRPRIVIGIGTFAEQRARTALSDTGIAVRKIAHPSPANPAANGDWSRLVSRQLKANGVPGL